MAATELAHRLKLQIEIFLSLSTAFLGAQLAAFGYWQHSGCDFGVLSAEDFAWSGPGCPCVPGTPGCLRDAVPGQPWWEPYVYLGTPLALYGFTSDPMVERRILDEIPSGNAMFNDVEAKVGDAADAGDGGAEA